MRLMSDTRGKDEQAPPSATGAHTDHALCLIRAGKGARIYVPTVYRIIGSSTLRERRLTILHKSLLKLTPSMRDLLGLAFEAIESPNMDCADIALFQLSFGDIYCCWRQRPGCCMAENNEMPRCMHQYCTVLQ